MTPQNDYLQLLKWCLHADEMALDEALVGRINWHELKEFAKNQAIVGVYWHGIQQGVRLTDDDVLDWMSTTEAIRRRSKKMNQYTEQIAAYFLRHGFPNCILKGQGNAQLYPDPLLRMSGDVDIWVQGPRERVISFVLSKVKPKQIQYHHVDFPLDPDVEVEVHFKPAYVQNPLVNRRLQRYFQTQSERQFSHVVSEGEAAAAYAVPTPDFNVVFQLLHIYKHFLYEGIGLRQLVDFFYLLRHFRAEADEDMRQEVANRLKEFHLRKFAAAVMYVMRDAFALEDDCLLLPPNEREGRFLLTEILRSGNFGQGNEELSELKSSSGVGHYARRQQFLARYFAHYPGELLFSPWETVRNFLEIRYNKRHYKL